MIELLSDSRTVIAALLGALLAVVLWIGRRKLQRLDAIETEAVRKTELAKMESNIRMERERFHAENSERLERIEDTVTRTHASLIDIGVMNQRILNAEQRIQELRDFKHDHCEPAVRYIDYLKIEKPWDRK